MLVEVLLFTDFLLVCCAAMFFSFFIYPMLMLLGQNISCIFLLFLAIYSATYSNLNNVSRKIHQIMLPSLHLLLSFLKYHASKVSVRSVSLISLKGKLRQKR